MTSPPNYKCTDKLDYKSTQSGFVSIVIVFFTSLIIFLAVLDRKKFFFVINQSIETLKLINVTYLTYIVATVAITILLVWGKDQITKHYVKMRQKLIARLITKFNQRFNDLQSQMIDNYSIYDNDAIFAINEARALLGTLIERLEKVNLFLEGKKRIHIYDALEEVTKPLIFGEATSSVLQTTEPFRETKLEDLEDRLEELLERGAKPLGQIRKADRLLEYQEEDNNKA